MIDLPHSTWRVAPRTWPLPPARLRDPGHDIHVFRADLDDPLRKHELYRLMLEEAELRRVDAVAHARTRGRLAVSLGLVRVIAAAHPVDPSQPSLQVATTRLHGDAVFAAARDPRFGLALVPAAKGLRGVAFAALEAIGHAGGRVQDPEAVDTSRVARGLAAGRAASIRVTSPHANWAVQVVALHAHAILVIATHGRGRTLHCWQLGA